MIAALKAPMVWFGGKSRCAPLVWSRFGAVNNLVDPFCGSLAVLLGRPTPFDGTETVNDADGFLANAWRAIQADPEAVADHADRPVSECDLHAYHCWLVEQRDTFVAKLMGDPEFYDAKVAGIWLWGIACWIGSGWCSGKGPWQAVEMEDGSRQLVHLGGAGRGVNRKLVHLGDAGRGVNRKRVHLGDAGQGVNRQRVHLGNAGQGVNRKRDGHRAALIAYMQALSARLRHVRVCCGDWSRVMGPSPMFPNGRSSKSYRVGVFLDPPYADTAGRDGDLYRVDSLSVAHKVREWALAHGDDPRYRICLAGYSGEHAMPPEWECVAWKAAGGYSSQRKGAKSLNPHRERLWFSPGCLAAQSLPAGAAS
jgi:hypothetical protein